MNHLKQVRRPFLALVVGTGIIGAIALVWWLIALIAGAMWDQSGFDVWRAYRTGFSPVSRNGQVFDLIIYLICFAVAFFIELDSGGGYSDSTADDEGFRSEGTSLALGITYLVLVIAFIISAGTTDRKLEASRYVNSTSFEYASKAKPPRILEHLLTGQSDLHATIVADKPIDFLSKGFDDRPASLVGAQRVMSERATGDSKADIFDDTYAYLPGNEGHGKWSAIRDGEGKRVHADSIVEWDGSTENVHQCRFEGSNSLNYAIRGNFANSLPDAIRQTVDDNVYWSSVDIYGYCDGKDNPVIVIPVKTDNWVGTRSIEVPAGVVIVRGSDSGEPVIEYKRSVNRGELPGPVYPISIAYKQREMSVWAAGRKWADNDFGFEPVNIGSNAGNTSEYNLRSLKDQGNYFVTPLTPRGSRSQAIVAVALVESDTVSYGQLNTLHIQVHREEDPNILTENDLERRAREVLRKVDPAFLNKGQNGELQEFIPSADGYWTAFAVQSGQPRYLLRIRPGQQDQAFELDGGEIGRALYDGGDTEPVKPGETPGDGGEATAITGLTDDQIQSRIDAVITELSQLNSEQQRRRR